MKGGGGGGGSGGGLGLESGEVGEREQSKNVKLRTRWMDGRHAILHPFQQYFSHIGTMGG